MRYTAGIDVGSTYAKALILPEAGAIARLTIQQLLASGAIATDLGELIVAIAERAPNAHIVVTDYPVPFAPGPIPATTIVNEATLALDAQIASAVQGAQFAGADVELASVLAAFAAHPVGSPDPWLGADPANPLPFLHPTAVGQDAYRDVIVTALAN